jgi:Fe-S-cluster containining protein
MSDHLCVSCSLCCNGSLFSRVPVTEDEKVRMGGGPNFFKKGGDYRMKLGCSRLGYDGGCQSYDIRPETCRSYKCRLLKRVEAEEVSEFDAVELVAEIKHAQSKAKAWIAKAQNKEPQELTMILAGDALKQLNEAEKSGEIELDRKSVAHGHLWHKHYVEMIRLHIKPSFLK